MKTGFSFRKEGSVVLMYKKVVVSLRFHRHSKCQSEWYSSDSNTRVRTSISATWASLKVLNNCDLRKKNVALKTRERYYGELLTLQSLQTRKESAMKKLFEPQPWPQTWHMWEIRYRTLESSQIFRPLKHHIWLHIKTELCSKGRITTSDK